MAAAEEQPVQRVRDQGLTLKHCAVDCKATAAKIPTVAMAATPTAVTTCLGQRRPAEEEEVEVLSDPQPVLVSDLFEGKLNFLN